MSHTNCCAVKCKNTGKNSNIHFYKFPVSAHKKVQRQKWIAAIRKENGYDETWTPKPWARICSEHFIGGQKSQSVLSPGFLPTIFSGNVPGSNLQKHEAMLSKHERFMKRRLVEGKSRVEPLKSKGPSKQDSKQGPQNQPVLVTPTILDQVSVTDESFVFVDQLSMKLDKGSQVFVPFLDRHHNELSNNFTCDRYIYSDKNYCDAAVQTDTIEMGISIKIPNIKQVKDKSSNTECKTFVDQSSGPDFISHETKDKRFAGMSSVKTPRQLLVVAGVSSDTFKFLLKQMPELTYSKISKEDHLLIVLIKIKTGLTFCAIDIFFCICETSVSRIFHKILRHLVSTTKNLVFWPDQDTVQITMPECFKPNYENTRVIIDCTEFKIQVPAGIDKRVYTYSHYKKGFTAKLLVGITPSGFISFKSNVARGRKSDSKLTIESGLIELLEDGDVVLAEKGFPQIRSSIDKTGKAAILVMPPFLEKKSEFTKEEAERTYEIAKVRIHVERIMQRLRTHKISTSGLEGLEEGNIS